MGGPQVSRRTIFSYKKSSRTKSPTIESRMASQKTGMAVVISPTSSESPDTMRNAAAHDVIIPGPTTNSKPETNDRVTETDDSFSTTITSLIPIQPTSTNFRRDETMKLARAKRSLACFSTSLIELEDEEEIGKEQHQFENPEASSFCSSSTQSALSLSSTSTSSIPQQEPLSQSEDLETTKWFGADVRRYTQDSPHAPTFDKDLRSFMEPHIAKARKIREQKREEIVRALGNELDSFGETSSSSTNASRYRRPQHLVSTSIPINIGVPYPQLRQERAFLFDVETYPLHKILAKTLGVEDLTLLHKNHNRDKRELLKPLLDPTLRKEFHKCYDNFVTSLCIPDLHSEAMRNNLFHSSSLKNVKYRYQAFPCLRIVRPGEFSIGPHCDMSYGHSLGNLNFHIPLTPTYGTNALFTERHTGREDWHPLTTKSFGLGYRFDGARCLHFTLENTTEYTRVSLDFRIAICRDVFSSPLSSPSISPLSGSFPGDGSLKERDEEEKEDEVLSDCKVLKDKYSKVPGYYEEAFIHLGTNHLNPYSNFAPGPVVYKKNEELMHPDKRVGFPF